MATEDVAPAQSKIEIARIAKEALIERAKELADSTDWRKTTDEQRTLMEQWRAAGYAGKELNDKLWDEFRAARDTFFTRRDEHYTELRAEQAKVVEAKKQIIEEAKQLTADVQNWVRTSDALNALMDRWKAAGNAGRDNEHALWEEFNGIRRDFRNRRKADLAERRARAGGSLCANDGLRLFRGVKLPGTLSGTPGTEDGTEPSAPGVSRTILQGRRARRACPAASAPQPGLW